MRKPKSQTRKYDQVHGGLRKRKNWRQRRRDRIADIKTTEYRYRRYYRSVLALIFARRRKKSESLEEYRLRLINLELISCIMILVGIIIYLLTTSR